MSLKPEKDKAKQLQDKCQSVLTSLLRDEDNKYCVDCDSKGPRWASWNIGVFLCIRCAGIHRNLGVHISKVKSVNLDSWTPEQVVSLQQMGNSRARAVYEANLPDNFRRPQNDSSLESFIRAKYEHKKYIAREWVAPPLPKVNWEKEIDEEIEKQKRKKKTILEKKPLTNVEVPQLPKPTNPSPKPTRSASHTPEVKEKHKHSSDLLGINGEDSFSNFISATPVAVTSNPPEQPEPETVKSEEESFFNQALPVEKEKTKLDKDSILALYASAPAMSQFQSAPFQATFQPPQQQSFQGFGSFAPGPVGVSSFPVQNGAPPGGQFVQQANGGGFQNWNKGFTPAQTQNQFIPNQFAQPAQFQNGQSNQFQNGVPNAQFTAAFPPQFATNPAPSNGLFNNQTMPLQQQFGNMAIGGAAPTNIWQ